MSNDTLKHASILLKQILRVLLLVKIFWVDILLQKCIKDKVFTMKL
ncbi:hypothetical protein MTR67_045019 [Solanum verrucosum]|uniref:Uncharacterized protein n=1 Tax=Solanum verrucosum TaxID=315347 RepID=A0AAF0ZWL3_SOLVR|nr:hypothetical protein MTR67_045019 [Solanum verrucosum]